MFQLEDVSMRVEVVLGTEKSSSVLQPAVRLNMKTRDQQGRQQTSHLTLDLKTFETLRFCVAKSLSATDQYRFK